MNINVHIDRLILDGLDLDGLDPDALSGDVRLALERLLVERGPHDSLAAGGSWGSVRGGDLSGPTAPHEDLGSRIADAIYAGLSGQEGARP